MNSKAIQVENISHSYNGLKALDRVSYEVKPGEIFGLLGPNGAGKTTMIRILTGQLRPTAGQAWVAGWDVVEERDQLKPRVGVVFEFQNLYTRLSARDNLVFSARLYGVPKTRVDEVLLQVGLADRAKEPIKKYSNGMKQRLLIARALLHYPEVLFLDEPTRGLDPNIARSIRSLILDLSQKGMTIFLTTHYMEEADQLCERVAFLDNGRMVALDTPRGHKAAYGGEKAFTLEDVFVHLTGDGLNN
jgi:ABC-2 type transport system ATP-binding protein